MAITLKSYRSERAKFKLLNLDKNSPSQVSIITPRNNKSYRNILNEKLVKKVE